MWEATGVGLRARGGVEFAEEEAEVDVYSNDGCESSMDQHGRVGRGKEEVHLPSPIFQ